MRVRLVIAVFASLALLVAACVGSSEQAAKSPSTETTQVPATDVTDAPEPTPAVSAPTTTLAPPPEPTPPAPTTTSTPAPAPQDLVLAGDGIGVAEFGDNPEQAMAAVTAILGEPDLDTGWGDPSDESSDIWGCPGPQARIVVWRHVMGLAFTTWDYEASPPGQSTATDPWFAGAGLWPESPITTVEGVGSGATLRTLRDVYGDRLFISDEPDLAVSLYWFAVDGDGSPLSRLGGVRGWLFAPDYAGGQFPADPPADDWVARGFTAGMSCGTP